MAASCGDDGTVRADGGAPVEPEDSATVVVEARQVSDDGRPDWLPRVWSLTLDPASIGAEQGRAFIYHLPAHWRPAASDMEDSTRSQTVLTEDGVELGPPNAAHAIIRQDGGGAYSHWNSSLYFSSSDGSDPRTNGRVYRAVVPADARVAPDVSAWLAEVVVDRASAEYRIALEGAVGGGEWVELSNPGEIEVADPRLYVVRNGGMELLGFFDHGFVLRSGDRVRFAWEPWSGTPVADAAAAAAWSWEGAVDDPSNEGLETALALPYPAVDGHLTIAGATTPEWSLDVRTDDDSWARVVVPPGDSTDGRLDVPLGVLLGTRDEPARSISIRLAAGEEQVAPVRVGVGFLMAVDRPVRPALASGVRHFAFRSATEDGRVTIRHGILSE